ncbi:MAG: purine-cytosine permease family protein [Solirubrobacteraceae bacterium]
MSAPVVDNGAAIAPNEIETNSIDHIPPSERHGRVRDQFTFWFAATMNIFNIVLGGICVLIGLNFFWACVAIVLGTILGLMLVGFHAMQGPRLGVPQMIQSRGQFGFYGAVFVFAASIVLDFGFLAAQLVIQAEAMHLLISGVSMPVWMLIITVPVVFLAVFGYEWIHRWQRWLTVVLGVTFLVMFVQALAYGGLPKAAAGTHLPAFALFVAAVVLFVMDMLSWAPYVSDYSRYLPESVSPRKTFWAVFLGNAIPTIFCGILGAYITGLLPKSVSTVAAVQHVSGSWALVVLAISLIGSDAINAYTGMLALASIASCFADVRHRLSTRLLGTALLIAAGLITALLGYKSFVAHLSQFLNVLLFVFIPWSAINLIDYYFVKRGRYDVNSFFTPRGRYGGWLWRGLIPYILAVGIQVPFLNQEFYVGPLVKPLGGVDISWLVGGVAAVVFYLLALRVPYGSDRASQAPVALEEPELQTGALT